MDYKKLSFTGLFERASARRHAHGGRWPRPRRAVRKGLSRPLFDEWSRLCLLLHRRISRMCEGLPLRLESGDVAWLPQVASQRAAGAGAFVVGRCLDTWSRGEDRTTFKTFPCSQGCRSPRRAPVWRLGSMSVCWQHGLLGAGILPGRIRAGEGGLDNDSLTALVRAFRRWPRRRNRSNQDPDEIITSGHLFPVVGRFFDGNIVAVRQLVCNAFWSNRTGLVSSYRFGTRDVSPPTAGCRFSPQPTYPVRLRREALAQVKASSVDPAECAHRHHPPRFRSLRRPCRLSESRRAPHRAGEESRRRRAALVGRKR